MNRTRFLFALTLLAASAVLLSCRSCQQPGPDKPEPPKVWKAPKEAPAVVILNREGDCDAAAIGQSVRGFDVQPLAVARQGSRVPVPEALRRYCVIRAQSPQQGPPPPLSAADMERIQATLPKDYLSGPDYAVVLSAASPLVELPPPELRVTFLERAGAVDTDQSQFPQSGFQPTRIALLDTVKGSGAEWPLAHLATDGHGAPLARLMEELLCPGGDPNQTCLGEVVGYEAMPSVLPNGSRAGTLNDLAASITDAVVDAAGQRQIMNLSLGWVPVPDLGGDDLASLPPATQAVYDALRFAVCHQTVVFAAAGNDLGAPAGGFDDGPVYPAGWQGPSKAPFSCAPYGGQGNFEGTIVNAVGAVGHAGRRIALTRDGSFPNLVAYGVDGVAGKVIASPPPTDQLTAPLTGTSVATAVVSAAAAARWALQPALDAKNLENAVRTPVTASPETADFKYGSNTVSRLKVCEQITAACTATSNCPAVTCLAETAAGPSAATLSTIASQLTTKTVSGLTPKNCPDGTTVLGVPGNTTCMDGLTTSIDETPWVHPQPGCDPCVVCFLERTGAGSGRFLGSLNDACLSTSGSWLIMNAGASQSILDLGGIVQASGLGGAMGGDGLVIEGLAFPPAVASSRVVVSDGTGVVSTAGELLLLP